MLLRSRKSRRTNVPPEKPKKKTSFASPTCTGSTTRPTVTAKPTFMRDNFSSSFRRSFRGRLSRPISAPSNGPGSKPLWVPAPGKAYKNRSSSPQKKYPLCLVCAKPWDYYLGRESFQEDRNQKHLAGEECYSEKDLSSMLKENVKAIKQLDNALKHRTEKQRSKVLKGLYHMATGQEHPAAEEDIEEDSEEEDDGHQSSSSLLKWQDLLKTTGKSSPDQEIEVVKGKNGDKVTIYHPKTKKKPKKEKHRPKSGRSHHRQTVEADCTSTSSTARSGIAEGANLSKIVDSQRVNLAETNKASKEILKEEMMGKKKKKKRESDQQSLDSIQSLAASEEAKPSPVKLPESSRALVQQVQGDGSSGGLDSTNGYRRSSAENDFFIEVLIDELKRENADLKAALLARESQLSKAADRIQEMVEEKSKLAKKLERALSRAHEHAENYDEEIQSKVTRYKKRIQELQDRVDDLEQRDVVRDSQQRGDEIKMVELLRKQLAESEENNKNLQAYISSLKQSYVSTFGSLNESEN